MKGSSTLIFDIGKTTKKALVFDEFFHVLEEKTTTLQETQDDEGFPCEDLDLLTGWVTETAEHFIQHRSLHVTHLNFSGYGASLVCLDMDGKPLLPFYNYLKTYPGDLEKKFRSNYDHDHRFCEDTSSPWLGMLNSGLQAYWLKHKKPDSFKRIATLLHFPQYFPFLLTGKKLCDVTSIGCHTMLWNFKTSQYHSWTEQEGIARLFPPRVSPQHHFQFNHNGRTLTSGTGVHDSSAALMPYLVSMKEPFLLLSSGTWNICFNPFNAAPLSREELMKDCLCYLTFDGKPVKASRIFLGHEHEVQQKALANFFGKETGAHNKVTFDEGIYQSLCESGAVEKTFYPMEMEGTGPLFEKQVNQTNYSAFISYEEAQHQFIRSLVQWQRLSIDLVDPGGKVKNIILVGGFSKSDLFIATMKREMKGRTILLSEHPRASALGAAWLVHEPRVYREASSLLQVKKV